MSSQSSEIGFNLALLSPRYWLSWLMIGLMWLIHWLPRRWVMFLGASLGNQFGKRNQKRRKIAEINLQLCFPEMNTLQREILLKTHYQRFGQNLLDLGQVWWASEERLRRLVSISGDGDSLALVGQERVIYITPHVIGMEVGGLRLWLEQQGISMMKRDRNPLVSWLFWRGRSRLPNSSMVMRDQGLRAVIHALKAGKFFYYIPDEDFGEGKHSVFAPFFGQQRSTLNTVSRLARITRSTVIPCMSTLNPDSGAYDLVLAPPLSDFPSCDMQHDAGTVNLAFENLIKKAPAQYLWTHRWFRTQPDGASSPYPETKGTKGS